MAVFSTNQARQFYVVEAVKTTTPSAEGDIFVGSDANGCIYFQHYGKGGLTRSDLIDPANVIYTKATDATAMQHKMKVVTVKLDPEVNEGKPISGQDYLLRIVINPYIGMSDEEPYIKHGVVHATAAMKDAPAKFYLTLAKSLAMNFSRELGKMLKFSVITETTSDSNTTVTATEVTASTDISTLTGSYVGIQIEEVEQEWRLGVKEQTFVNFDVYPTTVTVDGDDLKWGVTTVGESSITINNGKKIADLEYFCMGERGDQYRNIGWPNVVPTNYMVDPSKPYYVLDIHFAYVGAGEGPQKSEKDITIVSSTKATLNSLISKINAKKASLVAALS